MVFVRCLLAGCLVAIGVTSADAQVSFRQGSFDTAIPAFGGYDPSSAGRATFSNRSRSFSFRQGSFDATLPAFGGYTPNSGGRLSFSTRRPATFRQGTASAALPPFGGFSPNDVARLQFGNANAPAVANADANQEADAAELANDENADRPADARALGLLNQSRKARGNSPAVRPRTPVPNAPPQANDVERTASQRDSNREARRDARRDNAIARLLKKAEAAESANRIGQAKMYYRMAIKRAPDGSLDALEARLEKLK